MKKTQGNSEEAQKSTEAEKIITSQSKEVKTDEKIGTTSEATEKNWRKTKQQTKEDQRKEKRKRAVKEILTHRYRAIQGRRAEVSGRHSSLEAH